MKKLLIVWRDVNRTDIPIIDEQHRGIVTVINSLHEAIGTKREIKILEPATEMLLAYSKLHFMTEYELLEDSKYPALEAHNKLHDQLIKDMAKHFSASRKEKDLTIMLDFLKAWWLNHINREDMLYKEHLKKFLKIDEAE